ncbi:MAG TPA: rhamnogalacturonan lyase [Longimicrobiales bacterium]|nr:rhamnogalacturonan lyase [Longimicrobiales bacterium]
MRAVLRLSWLSAALASAIPASPALAVQRWMEQLDRGVVAIQHEPGNVVVSWRVLGTDPEEVAFNVYRSTAGGAPVLLTPAPITGATFFEDRGVDLSRSQTYTVRPVVNGAETTDPIERGWTLEAGAPVRTYHAVPIRRPEEGYRPNDGSVADLTGDGRYEIVVKMERSTRDNSQNGITDPTFLHAYTLDGELLWEIDLGINIRSGAHYTQFLVYDFDGDGRAEVVARTGDGTVDGTGRVIGDPNADHRNADGHIITGPEYLTVFDGRTGAALATVDYVPPRHPDTLQPAPEQLEAIWGDGRGNRVDRFLAGVAYLDGERPSIIMARGYYTRAVIAAWDWRDGELRLRWVFDSDDGTPGHEALRGEGAHSLAITDVNGDGFDDIVYGAAAIRHDGTPLYATGLGHGDALHVSQMDPDDPRIMAFMPHETPARYGPNAISLRDAATGELLLGVSGTGDIGRGVAMDIDPRFPGYELWATGDVPGIYNVRSVRADGEAGPRGVPISMNRPNSVNFAIWWDGDLLRELLDRNYVEKWNWETEQIERLVTFEGAASNNGTKATPVLSGDILGDWREEVVLRSEDDTELRIYTTTIPTGFRFPTLMHDPTYRLAIAWQNVAYNQPPHPGFFLGHGMRAAPRPAIVAVPAASTRE